MNATGPDSGDAGAASFLIEGQRIAAPPIAPGLYIVSTPIGNLRDMTIRGLATLARADLIACEDTRVTAVLVRHYGIRVPLLAYHEHNAAQQRPRLLAALAEGKVVALVSDAGTPLISDPGYRLVGEVLEAGHEVVPIPGASAILAALVTAALPTDAFLFAGFLPTRTVGRRKRLAELAAAPATLVFYESPHRTAEALADMAETLGGERPAAVARELTKTFETIRRGTLGTLAAEFAGTSPKGEIVILVAPPAAEAPDAEAADELLARLLEEHPVREAARLVAAATGLPRRDLYRRALEMKGAQADPDDA